MKSTLDCLVNCLNSIAAHLADGAKRALRTAARPLVAIVVAGAVLATGPTGCGGGGGSSAPSSASNGGTSTGGGTTTGGGTAGSTPSCASDPALPASSGNVAVVVVDSGPIDPATGLCVNSINVPYVAVTVCYPGSTTACATIDHVLVDTGSTGLRIMSSALGTALGLPALTNSAGSQNVVECLPFADGYSWGSVRQADVRIAGEVASRLSIQVIGDSSAVPVPSDCSSTGPAENTVTSFGANGVLGVGLFQQDCGTACVASAIAATYYLCSTSCTGTSLALNLQVQDPVSLFTTDNNGVILDLPAVSSSIGSSTVGAVNPFGSLYFGIGTQTNNALGTASVYGVNDTGSDAGDFTVSYNGTDYPESFIDSGSNLIFLPDPSSTIQTCTTNPAVGFFCPASTLLITDTNRGTSGTTSASLSFSIANANNLLDAYPTATAFDDIGAPSSIIQGGNIAGVDYGLPFFLGRKVYVAIEGHSINGYAGPFWAF